MNRRRQPTKRPSRHRRRLFALQGLIVIGLGAIAWKLAYVQHEFGGMLLADAAKADTVDGVLTAPRGQILDDQGRQLAYDLPAYTMDINVKPLLPHLNEISAIIASSIGDTPARVYARLSQYPNGWVEWPHPVLEPAREEITAKISKFITNPPVGDLVTFTPTEQRFYPNGVFASNVIGYLNSQGAQAGIEYQYDRYLKGTNGSYTYTEQADGFPVESTYKVTQPARSGDDVQLTIDQTVQGFVENAMNDLVKKDKPANAAIIVMNPKTGAILAMSSRPSFDPNNFTKATAHALSSNWAVNESFEPGSTFKPVVLAAALATHKISLSDTFMSGRTSVDGYTINDWNWGLGWGVLTYLGALEKSSNVGFAKIAERLGWPDLLTYMKRFGFLDNTGIDLPNEGNSITFSKQNQGPLQLATSGFGQGISVTPLQEMDAIAAIANGGTLYKPYLASAILDPTTHQVVKRYSPTVVRSNVVPQSVAAQVSQAMVDDVNASAGIDKTAIIPGYDVAGKTGTAQIEDPVHGGYYSNRFNVSFVGYAPGWDPQFEVYVTVNWPKTPIGNTWGSTIAAPTAAEILKACLEYYHVPPRTSAASQVQTIPTVDKTSYVSVPNFVGQSVQTAKGQASQQKLSVDVIGNGSRIVGQWPAAGTEMASGDTMYVSTSGQDGKDGTMPNLTGAPLRLAGEVLASMGITMDPVGTGFVVKQSIAAGQPVPAGATVTLTLSPTPVSPGSVSASKP